MHISTNNQVDIGYIIHNVSFSHLAQLHFFFTMIHIFHLAELVDFLTTTYICNLCMQTYFEH